MHACMHACMRMCVAAHACVRACRCLSHEPLMCVCVLVLRAWHAACAPLSSAEGIAASARAGALLMHHNRTWLAYPCPETGLDWWWWCGCGHTHGRRAHLAH